MSSCHHMNKEVATKEGIEQWIVFSLNENYYITANFITTFFENVFKKLRNYFDIEYNEK